MVVHGSWVSVVVHGSWVDFGVARLRWLGCDGWAVVGFVILISVSFHFSGFD